MSIVPLLKQVRARMTTFVKNPPKLIYVFFLIVFLELEESVQRAPTIRLLENAICLQHNRDRVFDHGIDEALCKTVPIQAKLARIRGMMSFFDALPGMTLSVARVICLTNSMSSYLLWLLLGLFGG